MNIELEKLLYALNQQFEQTIISTEYETIPLQGGTVASVYLVKGIAETEDNETYPYRIVLKIQKKWE